MNRKEKKNSLLTRLLGAACTVLLIVSVIYIANVGFNYISGLIILAAVSGIAGPSIATGDGVLDILTDIVEIVTEGIQTIIEAALDFFSSIFG